MTTRATAILQHLQVVTDLRQAASLDAGLAQRIKAIKAYQGTRFERSYADWLAKPEANRACRFFLEELYGAKDFSQRDAQFARIVPTMTRIFPEALSATIESLSKLHALSETMDQAMARNLAQPQIDASAYVTAWQATGQPEVRQQQIKLMHSVGTALAAYTRQPMLRRTLAFMRAPAAAAGLGSLQAFLESGFDAFASLPDAKLFLNDVTARETALCQRLDEINASQTPALVASAQDDPASTDPLGQLP